MKFDYGGKSPDIGRGVYIAVSAVVIGDVVIGEDSSVWFNAVVRGDENYIRIGARTNIQDNSVLHVTLHTHPLLIGSDVTVGHGAIVHGCSIRNGCLIGMGAIVLDGSVVGERSIVAAGSVVREGMIVPPDTLVAGVPAAVKRKLTEEDFGYLTGLVKKYADLRSDYLKTGY